jgi:methylated-DNA-protein-cysteine methyltransferase-like protein
VSSDRKRTESVPPQGTRETYYDRVYAFVRAVPRGRVVTYGQVALELGAPAAARAVGYALHNLPPGNDVPWWRVINVRGAIPLKGRGAHADLQRQLLEREGIVFDERDCTDLGRYRWYPGDA